MHPNLVDHLTAFIAVIETGSQSAAGRALRRPVSSINYSLVQLETQCGPAPVLFRSRAHVRRPFV
ncbi:helix-turn-helix domain-containing protein, partial [Haematobacter missouriensis]|uniref:helix-turn-helix domain-containing protein n=1 Tax=Haematobacter missouriensis TaxID=366616 RepID=UPI003C6D5180